MQEEFLCYLWQFKLIPIGLKTLDQEEIEVILPGQRNRDSGPDFFNARVRIGPTIWAGNVEIHVRSSDWFRHGHHSDSMYDSIILHLVWEHDLGVTAGNGLPTGRIIELKDKIDSKLINEYERMISSVGMIPCQNQLVELNPLVFYKMCERAIVERLIEKRKDVDRYLEATKGDWEEAFYRSLSRSFGLRVNADAMEQLAQTIPLRLVWRSISNVQQAEALFLGQAGLLLGNWDDRWLSDLHNEYLYLARLHHLKPLNPMVWKFARMRPISFPTIRIALFASMVFSIQPLFSRLIGLTSVEKVAQVMRVSASSYWNYHYYPDRESTFHNVIVGQQLSELIIINTLVPFLFAHGQINGDQAMINRSIAILEELPAEDNAMVRKWISFGVKCESALTSQGLLWLDKTYCSMFRCLECSIGHAVLKRV